MSDQRPGPGWWQASDGNWYPPSLGAAAPLANARPVQSSTTGTTALVFAIASFVICPVIAAVAALVFAGRAGREAAAIGAQPASVVTVAKVLAIINLVLTPFFAALLVAIAVPTFSTAQVRAQDRSAQSTLRTGVIAVKTYQTDAPGQPPPISELTQLEPSVTFRESDGLLTEDVVDVESGPGFTGLGTKSKSGTCFYLVSGEDGEAYAESNDCGPIAEQDYFDSWE